MADGVIVKGIGGFYYVQTQEAVVECKARGVFRKEGQTPVVGDRVRIAEKNGKGSIEEIYPRKNMLIRPAVSNIDQLVVTVALTDPAPNLFLVDCFLLLGAYTDIDTVLCFNKMDLTQDVSVAEIYKAAGYETILTSVQTGEGVDALKARLQNKTSAFAGNSGVGKSSILNALGISGEMETGSISDKIKRGRHTTRHVELLQLAGGGFVFDTPGFSSFETPQIPAEELAGCFREFAPYLDGCRFRGCAHVHEPDCAVKQALADGKISESRYQSYCTLYEERKAVKAWQK
ncbi:MAG: ribosome small subunit-dependent GTPase A [Clostridia bacterium]|nr:ribosome small subunit-dependent GTPase A [Clostridia bacterium]